MVKLLVNAELESILKPVIMIYFAILSQNISGGTEERHEIPLLQWLVLGSFSADV
jgi:hypothetical protein